MAPVLTVGANWLHLLATAAMIGIYLLLSLVFTPVFVQQLNGAALGKMVVGVYNKALPYLLLALLIFIVTGIYLTLTNDQYTGMAQINNSGRCCC